MAKTSNRNANNGAGSDSSAPNGSAHPTNNEDPMRSIINPLSQLITIKLEENNFLIWKFQVENMILGYGLEDFIHGTCNVPPRIRDGESNPAFICHQRQDRLLVSWLLASISTSYLPQLIGCSSSQKIWTTIEQLFSS